MLGRARKFLQNHYILLTLTILLILQLDDCNADTNDQCLQIQPNSINPFLGFDYEIATTLATSYAILSTNVGIDSAKFFLFMFEEKNTSQLNSHLNFISRLGGTNFAPDMVLFPSIDFNQQLDCNAICITPKTIISYKINSTPRRVQKNCAQKNGQLLNFDNDNFICQGWDNTKQIKSLEDIRNMDKIRGVLKKLQPLRDNIGAVYAKFGIESLRKQKLSTTETSELIKRSIEIGASIQSLTQKIPAVYFTNDYLLQQRKKLLNSTTKLKTKVNAYEHTEDLYFTTTHLYSTLSELFNRLSDITPESNQTIIAQRDKHVGTALHSLKEHGGNVFAFFGKSFLMQGNSPRKEIAEQLATIPHVILSKRK